MTKPGAELLITAGEHLRALADLTKDVDTQLTLHAAADDLQREAIAALKFLDPKYADA
jgi:hypothetical protein